MDTVNAIAKARFASARPQRVQLFRDETLCVELLCLEPGQGVSVREGQWVYYIIAGKATVSVGSDSHELSTGFSAFAAADEQHKLSNAAETRLICLAVERRD